MTTTPAQRSNGSIALTLRVTRFTPRQERARKQRNPFAAQSPSSPFAQRKRQRGKQWVQEYQLNVYPQDTILDCLLAVKRDIDPTLAFRYSCGHGMCGSDAVSINGTPTLLCTATVAAWAKKNTPIHATDSSGFRQTGVPLNTSAGSSAKNDEQREIQENTAPSAGFDSLGTSNEQDCTQHNGAEAMTVDLAPLPGFPVQRDLIADIDQMMEQIKRLKPYLQASGQLHTTQDGAVNMFEYLQSPEELQRFELLSNCIACGVCEGSCPVYAGGEAFIGPAALVINSRFINDSRDDATRERLDDISDADGIAACQSVRACSRHCPKGIDVGEEMWKLVELRPSGR